MNSSGPPPGGFGGNPTPPLTSPHGHAPDGGPKGGQSLALVIVLVVVVVLVVSVGILSVLAIFGVRKYIANAKTAEARNSLGMIAKLAAEAYEAEGSADGKSRALCKSASSPVPREASAISGKKYASSANEWSVDSKTPGTGFACLKFELGTPQYYQYDYQRASPSAFTARAKGDLNGDGVFSTFEARGQVQGERVVIAPTLTETSPDE